MFKQKAGENDPFGSSQEQKLLKTKPLEAPFDPHKTAKLLGQESVTANRGERVLCCCGAPGCSIGPMTRVETL